MMYKTRMQSKGIDKFMSHRHSDYAIAKKLTSFANHFAPTCTWESPRGSTLHTMYELGSECKKGHYLRH